MPIGKDVHMGIYKDMFDCKEDVISNFDIKESDLDGVEILYAEYVPGDYCGDAYVLFRKEDKLYEVSGSHCSCYGLEGQWEPTFTTVKAILMRPHLDDEFRKFVESL